MLKYGVDLVLHGHKHFYERESAINNFTASEIEKNPSAPWYIVNGAAGHYDGKAINFLLLSSRVTDSPIFKDSTFPLSPWSQPRES